MRSVTSKCPPSDDISLGINYLAPVLPSEAGLFLHRYPVALKIPSDVRAAAAAGATDEARFDVG
jgi:hypothetical protein